MTTVKIGQHALNLSYLAENSTVVTPLITATSATTTTFGGQNVVFNLKNFQFDRNINYPTIQHNQLTSDVEATSLIIASQSAFASATNYKDSGNLSLITGTPALGGNTGAVNLAPGGFISLSATTSNIICFTPTISFYIAASDPTITQEDSSSSTQNLTIKAQSTSSFFDTGGDLILSSGSAPYDNGNVKLQSGGYDVATVNKNKFIFNKGARRNVTNVNGNYSITINDDYLSITSLTTPITITLPDSLFSSNGDTYEIKDSAGSAGSYNVTLQPSSGQTIDGQSNFIISTNFQSVKLIFNNGNWERFCC